MSINGVEIFPHERLDDLHRSGYMIIQDPKRFCFGIDAVLLSGFAKAHVGEKVLDLGTGTGVIPILMSAKTKAESFVGIEIQKESANMARRSVLYNNLADKIEIIEGDVKTIGSLVKPASFSVVTANPPYMNSGGGIVGQFSPKAIARHELLLNLEDIMESAAYALKYKGRFYLVHRPHRLVDIVFYMRKYKLEPKIIRFIQPKDKKEPNMVLIEAVKEGGAMVKVLDPLIVYDENGEYTKEAYDIYYGT